VGPEQHPEPEERDERGDTRSCRAERDDDARREDAAEDQEEEALVHAPIFPASASGGFRPRPVGRRFSTTNAWHQMCDGSVTISPPEPPSLVVRERR
jgi:hypothetical protein